MQFSEVLLEVKVSTKSLSTRRTRVRFVFCVRVHVESKIARLVESFMAEVALELLFSGMG